MLKKTVYNLIKHLIGDNIEIEINNSYLITKAGGKIVVQRFLIADNVEYGFNELNEHEILKLMDNYASLLESLPPGIEIIVLKREKDLVRLMKRISNEMMNIRAKLDILEEPHLRARLLSQLKVLEELYKMIITSNTVARIQLLFKLRAESFDIADAMARIRQQEELVSSVFNNYFRIKLQPLSSSEIRSLIAYHLGITTDFKKRSIVLEHSRLQALTPIRRHAPVLPDSEETIVLGYDIDSDLPVGISIKSLFKHMAVLGPTGKGKTTLLATIIENMVSLFELKIVALDFKGDLARYIDEKMIDIVNPNIYPINILKKPQWLKLIDWGIIVRDVLENIVGLNTKNIAEILTLISKNVGVSEPEKILMDPHLSKLSPVIDLLINNPNYDELYRVLRNKNILFNISSHGTMFQNTYAGLILGMCSNILLQENTDNDKIKSNNTTELIGNVITIDEAWRISRLESLKRLIKEGRSRKVSIILATQNPSDIPRELYENIQTVIVFGSPNQEYQDQIRKLLGIPQKITRRLSYLGVGEALVVNTEARKPIIVKIKPPQGLRHKGMAS